MTLEGLCVPDDSGADAFQRFRYQAHVAFPHCLSCASGNGVVRVTCEHIEDLVVEEQDRVRFVQIKTRNLDYGPWRFKDLCRPRGGALTSLLRTHRALKKLKDPRELLYEIRLEGALERGDDIRRLGPAGGGATEDMAKLMSKTIRKATPITLADARTVLARCTVRTEPQRELIEDRNLRSMRSLAGHLPAHDLKAIYDAAINLICTAMETMMLADQWPAVIFEPQDADEDRAARVAGKRLEPERLLAVLGPLTGDALIQLEEVFDQAGSSGTVMADKLRRAGASEALIRQAQGLRAAATKREIEVRSRDRRGRADADFADLDARLLTLAVATADAVGDVEKPASKIFARLLERLAASPAAHDPKSLLAQDAYAMTGGVLQLSDECRFSWRSDA